MPDFVLIFGTYKFLENFMFMISPYQFGKEQFNFVCVGVCTTVIKKYSECSNKKNYYSKRHIAINPPQNTPSRFKHTYTIILATF